MATPGEAELQRRLEQFANGANIRERKAAVAELIKDRSIHSVVSHDLFRVGLERLATESHEGGADELQRAHAAVALARIGAVAKSLRPRIEELIQHTLATPPARPHLLQEPDDRRYLAQACAMATADWSANFFSDAVVMEESAEKARAEFARGLVLATTTLARSLELVASSLLQWKPGTESPADSLAKRLRRILTALRGVLREHVEDPGANVGSALGRLVSEPFRQLGRPDGETARDLANELCRFLHELVHVRFALATEATTYNALRLVKDCFSARQWERFVAKSSYPQRLARDIREGVILLARQGQTDDDLFAQLVVAVGSADRARAVTAALGQEIPGLTDAVRNWLVHGEVEYQEREGSTLAKQSQESEENLLLADMLVDSQRTAELGSLILDEALPEIRTLMPRIADELERYRKQSSALVDSIGSFGRRRRLRLREQRGDIVEYSPVDHTLTTETAAGVRRVRVVRPAVERIRDDNITEVVRKALVEPV